MDAHREKWDSKHARAEISGDPSPLLQQYIGKALPGRGLDLACGRGRNALFAAERGFEVDAVDISPVGLGRFQHPKIRKIEADLDDYRVECGVYGLIVNTLFLDRRLFVSIAAGLMPGGLLIYQAYLAESRHVGNPAYKLKRGELAAAFPGLESLHYEEAGGLASLVARRRGL